MSSASPGSLDPRKGTRHALDGNNGRLGNKQGVPKMITFGTPSFKFFKFQQILMKKLKYRNIKP